MGVCPHLRPSMLTRAVSAFGAPYCLIAQCECKQKGRPTGRIRVARPRVKRGNLTCSLHLHVFRAAEGARDKADTARRAAERRAKAADDELTALKGKLEAKTKQVLHRGSLGGIWPGGARHPRSCHASQCDVDWPERLVPGMVQRYFREPHKWDVPAQTCNCIPPAPQCTELEGSLSSAQAALERQRRGHEEALAALEAQQRAQAKKMSADLDSEKKGAQVQHRTGGLR